MASVSCFLGLGMETISYYVLKSINDLVADMVAAPQRPQPRQARLTFLMQRPLPLFHPVSTKFRQL
jgi:hypothetical protein